MKDVIRSLAIVIFGGYTLYVAYILLDNFMAQDPLPINGRGYIILIVSGIITMVLVWSLVLALTKERRQREKADLPSHIKTSVGKENIPWIILVVFRYIFGAIAMVYLGLMIGTPGETVFYHWVVLLSGTIGLILYWKS